MKPASQADEPPYNARTGAKADTTDPATWCKFTTAERVRGRYDGIGYAFAPDDGMVRRLHSPSVQSAVGRHRPVGARSILNDTRSYTEMAERVRAARAAPGHAPVRGAQAAAVEMYDRGRYFTMTGDRLEETPAEFARPHISRSTPCTRSFSRGPHRPRPTATPPPSRPPGDIRLQPPGRRSTIPPSSPGRGRRGTGPRRLRHLMTGAIEGRQLSVPLQRGPRALRPARLLDGPLPGSHGPKLFRTSQLMRPKWDERRGAVTYTAKAGTGEGAVAMCDETDAAGATTPATTPPLESDYLEPLATFLAERTPQHFVFHEPPVRHHAGAWGAGLARASSRSSWPWRRPPERPPSRWSASPRRARFPCSTSRRKIRGAA